MTATLDYSLIPPLGEPRPQPVPEAHESTLPDGLHLVVRKIDPGTNRVVGRIEIATNP